jgi:hypothetical protein
MARPPPRVRAFGLQSPCGSRRLPWRQRFRRRRHCAHGNRAHGGWMRPVPKERSPRAPGATSLHRWPMRASPRRAPSGLRAKACVGRSWPSLAFAAFAHPAQHSARHAGPELLPSLNHGGVSAPLARRASQACGRAHEVARDGSRASHSGAGMCRRATAMPQVRSAGSIRAIRGKALLVTFGKTKVTRGCGGGAPRGFFKQPPQSLITPPRRNGR